MSTRKRVKVKDINDPTSLKYISPPTIPTIPTTPTSSLNSSIMSPNPKSPKEEEADDVKPKLEFELFSTPIQAPRFKLKDVEEEDNKPGLSYNSIRSFQALPFPTSPSSSSSSSETFNNKKRTLVEINENDEDDESFNHNNNNNNNNVNVNSNGPNIIRPSNLHGKEIYWDKNVKTIITTTAKQVYKLSLEYLDCLDRENTIAINSGYQMFLYSEHQVQQAAWNQRGGQTYFNNYIQTLSDRAVAKAKRDGKDFKRKLLNPNQGPLAFVPYFKLRTKKDHIDTTSDIKPADHPTNSMPQTSEDWNDD